jgi:hypothetical protein
MAIAETLAGLLYGVVMLLGPYCLPVGVTFAASMRLLRGTGREFESVEYFVFWAPLLIWYLCLLLPHWSGKSMSNLIGDPLVLGLVVAGLTVARGVAGRNQPKRSHFGWYMLSVLCAPLLVWLAVPALPE